MVKILYMRIFLPVLTATRRLANQLNPSPMSEAAYPGLRGIKRDSGPGAATGGETFEQAVAEPLGEGHVADCLADVGFDLLFGAGQRVALGTAGELPRAARGR